MYKVLEAASATITRTALGYSQRSNTPQSSDAVPASNAKASLAQRLDALKLREKPFCLLDQYDGNNWLCNPVKLDGDDRMIVNRATLARYAEQPGEIINPFTGQNVVNYEDAKDIEEFVTSFEFLNNAIKEFEAFYNGSHQNVVEIEKSIEEFHMIDTDGEHIKNYAAVKEDELKATARNKATSVKAWTKAVIAPLKKLVNGYDNRYSNAKPGQALTNIHGRSLADSTHERIDRPGNELLDDLNILYREMARHQFLVGSSLTGSTTFSKSPSGSDILVKSNSLTLSGSATLLQQSDSTFVKSNSISLSGSTLFKQHYGEPENTLIERVKPMAPQLASVNKLAREHLSLPNEATVDNTLRLT